MKLNFVRTYPLQLSYLICLLFTCYGCNTSDDSTENLPDEYVMALIDGEPFEADQDQAGFEGIDADIHDEAGIIRVNIQGRLMEYFNIIDINIIHFDGVGTYITGDGVSLSSLIYQQSFPTPGFWVNGVTSDNAGVPPGEINVTYYDGEVIEGNFVFEGYYQIPGPFINVSEGIFRAIID